MTVAELMTILEGLPDRYDAELSVNVGIVGREGTHKRPVRGINVYHRPESTHGEGDSFNTDVQLVVTLDPPDG